MNKRPPSTPRNHLPKSIHPSSDDAILELAMRLFASADRPAPSIHCATPDCFCHYEIDRCSETAIQQARSFFKVWLKPHRKLGPPKVLMRHDDGSPLLTVEPILEDE